MVNRRLSGRNLHFYLNPERRTSEDAVQVHGLTDEFLADKPLFARDRRRAARLTSPAPRSSSTTPASTSASSTRNCAASARPTFTRTSRSVTDSLLMARELFPGKSNSLDALCKRLEVDNSNRALHGALLDAGLLAEVYIRMTRGQDSLVIDAGDDGGDADSARRDRPRALRAAGDRGQRRRSRGARGAAGRARQGERRPDDLAPLMA